jgi:hypothetical protein
MVDVSLPQHAKRFGFLALFWVIGDIIRGVLRRKLIIDPHFAGHKSLL